MTCIGCNRPMRAWTETLEDRPGTMRRGTRDLCVTCYGRKRRGIPLHTPIGASGPPPPTLVLECAGTCGRLTRPNYRKPDTAPGTVGRNAAGLCVACANAARKADATVVVPPESVEDRVARAQALAKLQPKPRTGLADYVDLMGPDSNGRYHYQCHTGDCRGRGYGLDEAQRNAKAYAHVNQKHLNEGEQ